MSRPTPPTQVRDDRNVFDRLAERISDIVAGAGFFTGGVLLVLLWVPFLPVVGNVDTWQLVLSTITSVAAFLLIALLQNTERRNDLALHRKVDMLAAALALQLRHGDQAAAPGVKEIIRELEAAVRLEERM